MPKKTNWKIRRTMMFIIVIFCMAVIWKAAPLPETENAVMAVKYSFYLLGVVVVVYVFGAITDDHIDQYITHKYGGEKRVGTD